MTKPTLASLQAELDTANARVAELEQRPTSVHVTTDPEISIHDDHDVTFHHQLVVDIVSPDGTQTMTITAHNPTVIRRTR